MIHTPDEANECEVPTPSTSEGPVLATYGNCADFRLLAMRHRAKAAMNLNGTRSIHEGMVVMLR